MFAAKIRRFVFSIPEGVLFASRDVPPYCTRTLIDQTLYRLCKHGVIVRIAHGIYMRESASGERPSVAEVASVRARIFCKEIVPCQFEGQKRKQSNSPGDEKVTFLSSGSGSFVYNNQRIHFKGVSPQKFARIKNEFDKSCQNENDASNLIVLNFDPRFPNSNVEPLVSSTSGANVINFDLSAKKESAE